MRMFDKFPGLGLATVFTLLAACATPGPQVPYPAFVQSADLPDIFLVELPGARAKQFAVDGKSHRSSNRLLLPADWDFSTGATPDKSVEIFVLNGEIELGGMTLKRGGYAWLPPGASGMNMRTRGGAELLYFVDDGNPRAAIQVPLISGIESARWKPLSDDPEDFGLSMMTLRSDPGSGAKTWLLKIDPVARQAWQSYSAAVEGYLVSGNYQHSECVDGHAVTGTYLPGGYFLRPADAVNGGPETISTGTSTWFMRTMIAGERKLLDACVAVAPQEAAP